MEDQAETVLSVMRRSGMPECGVAAFDELRAGLFSCVAAARLPQNASSVIVAVFPYFTGRQKGNLSMYARVEDYHLVAGEMLEAASRQLKALFPKNTFAHFCDNSPLPEVRAAMLAGLGVRGENGLLITERYGSFVFLGEIVTDLPLTPRGAPLAACIGCGKCVKSCPAGALDPGAVKRERCLSAVTQRKGELTAAEQEMLRGTGCVWGCDICQNVCPMNDGAGRTPIGRFLRDVRPSLGKEELQSPDFLKKNKNRAFVWKGTEILKRNLGIFALGAEKTKE